MRALRRTKRVGGASRQASRNGEAKTLGPIPQAATRERGGEFNEARGIEDGRVAVPAPCIVLLGLCGSMGWSGCAASLEYAGALNPECQHHEERETPTLLFDPRLR